MFPLRYVNAVYNLLEYMRALFFSLYIQNSKVLSANISNYLSDKK